MSYVKTIIILLILSVILVSGCNKNSDNNPEPYSGKGEEPGNVVIPDKIDPKEYAKDIFIKNSQFMPDEVKVKLGSEVTWINEDDEDYVIQSEDRGFESDSLAKGDSVTFNFDTPGTYVFYLTEKPDSKIKVIVE